MKYLLITYNVKSITILTPRLVRRGGPSLAMVEWLSFNKYLDL